MFAPAPGSIERVAGFPVDALDPGSRNMLLWSEKIAEPIFFIFVRTFHRIVPQAIVNWSIGATQVIVLRNRSDLGMNDIPFYQSHGFGSRKNIEQAEGAAEGVFSPLGACNIAESLPSSHPQKKVTMKYLEEYKAKYNNEELSSFGGHSWDALYMVVAALEAVGNDKAKIRDYVENIKGFVGQHGIFNYSQDDHNGLTKEASLNMVVVKDGDWALVE